MLLYITLKQMMVHYMWGERVNELTKLSEEIMMMMVVVEVVVAVVEEV